MSALRHKLVALFVMLCFVITAMAAPRSRPHPTRRHAAKIVFSSNDLVVQPGKSIVLKATALDQKDHAIEGAKIDWSLPKESAELVSITKPLNNADKNAIVLVGLNPSSGPAAAAEIKIHATSGAASGELKLRYGAEPAQISFVRDSINLAPGTKETIVARIQDAAGNEIHGLNVSWKLADKKFEDLVFLGPPVNNATTNCIDVVWLSETAQNSVKQAPIIARAGAASGVATLNFKPKENPKLELVFLDDNQETNAVEVGPQQEKKFKAIVRGEDGATMPNLKIDCELDDADRSFVELNAKPKGEFSLAGLGGDLKTMSRTILLPCRAENAAAVLVVRYDAGALEIEWAVLPPNIVGDSFGRTITRDYYCIEVTINNSSGSDLALAGLRFVNARQDISRPVASYSTVHGSLAKRKLTHPRSLTLAIVGGLGTLMTGFNPFFHDATHAKNYSQFIDILSNPLKSGLEKAWPDTYPDELSRFEQDVLRDDKIIANHTIFKAKVFVPKRSLFTNAQKKERENLDTVRETLGALYVLGYQFQKGPIHRLQTRTMRSASP